ncbi:MAG: thiosulfohydrolase SoxB [Deltaproteobacteria bacterium]|nr:thiosulfohydrolase SoxB [Deltaproteobacteria bacterium]
MSFSRREFLQVMGAAAVAGLVPGTLRASQHSSTNPYDFAKFGNVSLMHYTDCHAQLSPIYFREPHINLGIADMFGNPPHLVGEYLLKHFGIPANSPEAYAFSYLNFAEAAEKYGRVGGFAHLKSLVDQLRAERPGALLLDGGDTWQGSATSLWTNAQDMVDAQIKLGVDVMTAHWEFTYGAERVQEIIENDLANAGLDFVAQNVRDTDFEDPVFPAYVIREINGHAVAIIGQAFPYTPIANPRYMIPEWSFGIRDMEMQERVNEARDEGAEVVIVLSHNGMDVDLKMASRVSGIDAIMGGHTHDGVPQPIHIKNPDSGHTLVINSGSNSKFLSVLDLDVQDGKVKDFRYKLLPVFSELLPADAEMAAYIQSVREPYEQQLNEQLAMTEDTLYRRGNFNGTFDQVICDALMQELNAPIAFSPGFRWGVSILPGQPITFDEVMTQTAMTYGTVTRNELSGEQIKTILEDVADNLFNTDPYYQQGGDMVRVGGLQYSLNPTEKIGSRISDLELNGQPLNPRKNYPVGGWASVAAPLEGKQIWEVVSDFLRDKKVIKDVEPNIPKLKGIENNPGIVL